MKYKWPLMKNAITLLDKLKLVKFILTTNKFTQGKKVEEFEKKWSKWLGVKHSLFVSSGSTANTLLLSSIKELYNLQKGDKVIVPMVTWATNIAPVIQLGFEPIFCDINFNDFSFDINELKKISEKYNDIKIIFITHLLGFSSEILKIASLFPNAIILEDNCESHGALYNGKLKVGSINSSTFSFYFGHHMTTIEGGMVSTNDSKLYDIMKAKRAHGWAREMSKESFDKLSNENKDINKKFLFVTDGYNFRNTEIAAVLGLSQLKKLDNIIYKRTINWILFNTMLDEKYFYLQNLSPNNSNFALPFICKNKKLKEIMVSMFEKYGIETRPILTGNILKQPFLKQYSNRYTNQINANLIHENGFYIGNNQFVTKRNFKLLELLIKWSMEELYDNGRNNTR